jgi:hypothetical protein
VERECRTAWLLVSACLTVCCNGGSAQQSPTPSPSATPAFAPAVAGSCYEVTFQATSDLPEQDLPYVVLPRRVKLTTELAPDQRQGPWYELRYDVSVAPAPDYMARWQRNDAEGFDWFWSNGYVGSRGSFRRGAGRGLSGSAKTFSDTPGGEYSLTGEAHAIPCGPWTGPPSSEPERRRTRRSS